MENSEEIKVEEPKVEEPKVEEPKVEKKKGISLFTLFACIMTAFTVALATNIGQNLGIHFSGEDEPTKAKTEVKPNDNSNTTEPSSSKFTVESLTGVYGFETTDTVYTLALRDNGLFIYSTTPKAQGCTISTVGNYYIDGDKITYSDIVSIGCDGDAEISIEKNSGTLADKTVSYGTFTFNLKSNDVKEYGETNTDFIRKYIYESIGHGYTVQQATAH